MLTGILLLMVFNLLGFALVALLDLPIPAPVAGLVALLAFLLVRGSIPDSLAQATSRLLPLLPLFLIPASAGVVEYGALVRNEWLPILLALVISLLVSFLVTPFLFRLFVRMAGKS
jgi:holin-like protein